VTSLVAPLVDSPPLRRYGPPELMFGTSPAAGADFSFADSSGYWWRLLSLHARLVTSADAADRQAVVEYRDVQDQRFNLYGDPVTTPANTTIDYVWSVWHPEGVWPVDSTIIAPLGWDLLYPGCDFRLHVAALDNTDQLSRIRFQVERFYPPDDVGQPD
jgi:hypothetical protein